MSAILAHKRVRPAYLPRCAHLVRVIRCREGSLWQYCLIEMTPLQARVVSTSTRSRGHARTQVLSVLLGARHAIIASLMEIMFLAVPHVRIPEAGCRGLDVTSAWASPSPRAFIPRTCCRFFRLLLLSAGLFFGHRPWLLCHPVRLSFWYFCQWE